MDNKPNVLQEAAEKELRNMGYEVDEYCFVVKRVNCGTTIGGSIPTDIMCVVFDEEKAKSMQSVFCTYEKVKIKK